MDQVKKIGGILFAQRFWILCGVITLVPVGAWFTKTSEMRKMTEERKSAIKGKTDTAKNLLSKQGHPNEESHKLVDDLRIKVTSEVGDAWQLQYDRQRELLVWPAELEKDFIEKVDPLRPLEKVKPPANANEEILNPSLRERYRDYIFAELPKLAKKIDALWVVQEATEGAPGGDPSSSFGGGMMSGSYPGGMGSSYPGAPGGPNANKGPEVLQKVLWDPQDQTALRARYNWSHTKEKVPRTIDVLYVQEDLWIMSALMDIIAKTNQGSTGRYNSVIKEIKYIDMGRDVGGSSGSVMRVNASGAGGDASMMGMGMGMGMAMEASGGMGMMGAAPMAGAAGGAAGGMNAGFAGGAEGGGGMDPTGMMGMGGGMGMGMMIDPAQFRYVDPDYKPVPAETLRTAITSETPNKDNAFLVVAKRIPIRLGLTVDQRKLNRFITECGNAPLMIEVRQVRFNRQGGSAAAGGAGGGMGMMGMMGMGGGGGMSSMMGSGGSGGADGGESSSMSGFGGMMPGSGMMGSSGGYGSDPNSQGSEVSAHDKPVEVFGVVYLYNPVDLKKLGIEKKEGDPAAAPPAGNAAAPPAAAPAPAVGAT